MCKESKMKITISDATMRGNKKRFRDISMGLSWDREDEVQRNRWQLHVVVLTVINNYLGMQNCGWMLGSTWRIILLIHRYQVISV